MIYLASPYTHKDPFVREARYLAAAKKVIEYLQAGKFVYSPIVHCHELQKIASLPTEFTTFWKPYNLHMLDLASEFHVLGLEGWFESVGVAGEINHWLRENAARKWELLKP